MQELAVAEVAFGSNDLEKAKVFYDALFAVIGVSPLTDTPAGGRVYGDSLNRPFFAVLPPFDGKPATVGNGSMAGIDANSPEQVDELYAAAIAQGGTDEGPPGYRNLGPISLYVGYFRDLDGNKLAGFYFPPVDQED